MKLKFPKIKLNKENFKFKKIHILGFLLLLTVFALGFFVGHNQGYNQKIEYITSPKTDIKKLSPFEQYQRIKYKENEIKINEKTAPIPKINSNSKINENNNKENLNIKNSKEENINSDVEVVEVEVGEITE